VPSNDPENRYQNPLETRYCSAEMSQIWSNQRRFSTWRRLWASLARCQQKLGLEIGDSQISEMERHVDSIDFDAASKYERKLRHDVMAHVHAFGDQCPGARPIIHLGATSCFVTDNTDLILIRNALEIIIARLVSTLERLSAFAKTHRATPCLGLTHLQPAQPTTFGKRACLWIQDLLFDLETLEFRQGRLKARGVKGTTGTQASFLQLFGGDHGKVRELDRMVSREMGFADSYQVTGQTYSRKVDAEIIDALAGLAASAHKMATDIRILASRKELEEPFESDQIGSSAMAYKRNPMRSERVCGLARFLSSLQSSAGQTLATQWMERTLDDSSNRRLIIPQAFLAADAILILLDNISNGLVVYDRVAMQNLKDELPFMASESILMAAVQSGGDRQTLHELIRVHSQEAAKQVKLMAKPNDLLERLKKDTAFARVDFESLMDVNRFVGRAPEQVDEFLEESVAPATSRHQHRSAAESAPRV